MREIEAQAIGRHQRPLLLDMFAQHLSQGGMQEMRGGMIQRDRLAAITVDFGRDLVSDAQLTRVEHSYMRERRAYLPRVPYREMCGRADQRAGITYLTAAFRIKRCVIQHDLPFLPRPHGLNHRSVENQRRDFTLACQTIVSGKLSLPGQLDGLPQINAELTRGAGPAALRVHGRIETRLIDRQTALACDIRRQIEREAIGIVKPEDRLAGNHG